MYCNVAAISEEQAKILMGIAESYDPLFQRTPSKAFAPPLESLPSGSDGSEGKHSALTRALAPLLEGALSAPATSLSWYEEILCVLFLGFGVPNGALTIPAATFCIGYFLVGNVLLAFAVLLIILVALAILPQSYVPSFHYHYMSILLMRYFKFQFVFEDFHAVQQPFLQSLKAGSATSTSTESVYKPQVLIAPPHGVFPYGNVLAMMCWPYTVGHSFRGLAATAAVSVPPFKQQLRSIGIISASKSSALEALEKIHPYAIGISTGGVAEVFETNNHDEVVLLRERIGLIKLAIRTGADIVPAYIFGQTKLLSCWTGEGIPNGKQFLQSLSRKIGFALIAIYGRFGLPIPYRVPIVCCIGTPISTAHIPEKTRDNPSSSEILEIQEQIISQTHRIFDRYKHSYGWSDKSLIVR
jgi:1-acyl-sn-glycerol-3-phosphate acyltransferase